MYNDPSADAGSIVSSIDAALSESSTLDAITDLVKTESLGSADVSLLATLDVTGFVAGATTGKHLVRLYFIAQLFTAFLNNFFITQRRYTFQPLVPELLGGKNELL
jgi:hypothetical protein